MFTFEYDQEVLINTGCLFPPEISNDGNVLFHGTSNVSENQIEKVGFQALSNDLLTKANIYKILEIYDLMMWYGVQDEGFDVLKTFSMDDFKECDKKPNFFRESSHSSSTYTSESFVGGETYKAIRASIEDLEKYCIQESLQKEHSIAYLKYGKEFNAARPFYSNIEHISQRAVELRSYFQACFDLKNSYRYGIVYAIQVDDDLLKHFKNRKAQGYITYEKVDPQKILGKCILPKGVTLPRITYKQRLAFMSREFLKEIP